MSMFVFNEFREALGWVKSVLIEAAKWMFRWLLRWLMLFGLFILFLKGCQAVYFTATGHLIPKGTVQNGPPAADPVPVQGPGPESFSKPPNPAPADVRSLWSTLRYIGQDVTRWFRKR